MKTKIMIHNNNCDGAHCTSETGEVRTLPAGGDSNIILCAACFRHEIAFRRERNRELSKDCAFKLPDWESLKVYGEPAQPIPVRRLTMSEIKYLNQKAGHHSFDRQTLKFFGETARSYRAGKLTPDGLGQFVHRTTSKAGACTMVFKFSDATCKKLKE